MVWPSPEPKAVGWKLEKNIKILKLIRYRYIVCSWCDPKQIHNFYLTGVAVIDTPDSQYVM